MTFLDHLEVLRWHLIRAFISIFIFTILAFVYKTFIFDTILFAPTTSNFFTTDLLCDIGQKWNISALCINQKTISFQNFNMAGQFSSHIWISFIAGLTLAFPYVFWEIWRFIKPALHENEVKKSRGAAFFTSILFSIGILFAYFIIVPLSVHFLSNYQVSPKVENIISLNSYINTITSIVLAGGIIFELPVFIYFLAKIGIINSHFLRKFRRHSIVLALLLAAIITPPDVISQLLVCIPLVILYETGIIIAKRIERKRDKRN